MKTDTEISVEWFFGLGLGITRRHEVELHTPSRRIVKTTKRSYIIGCFEIIHVKNYLYA